MSSNWINCTNQLSSQRGRTEIKYTGATIDNVVNDLIKIDDSKDL